MVLAGKLLNSEFFPPIYPYKKARFLDCAAQRSKWHRSYSVNTKPYLSFQIFLFNFAFNLFYAFFRRRQIFRHSTAKFFNRFSHLCSYIEMGLTQSNNFFVAVLGISIIFLTSGKWSSTALELFLQASFALSITLTKFSHFVYSKTLGLLHLHA